MTTAPNRPRFRCSLRTFLLELVWISLALGLWVLLGRVGPPIPLEAAVIAFYTACGAAIGGLIGRAGWGAAAGLFLSSIAMAAIQIWPPSDL